MSAFNKIQVKVVCHHCEANVLLPIQFKFGDTWQHSYELGDIVRWGGNDLGKPHLRKVVVFGHAEDCPNCGSDPGEYYIIVENDRLVEVRKADGTYDFTKVERFIVEET